MEKNKINPDTLKDHMDLMIYIENQKNIKTNVEKMERDKEHYKLMLQNLL